MGQAVNSQVRGGDGGPWGLRRSQRSPRDHLVLQAAGPFQCCDRLRRQSYSVVVQSCIQPRRRGQKAVQHSGWSGPVVILALTIDG